MTQTGTTLPAPPRVGGVDLPAAAAAVRAARERLPFLVRVLGVYAGMTVVVTVLLHLELDASLDSRRFAFFFELLLWSLASLAAVAVWARWFWAAYGAVAAVGGARYPRLWAVVGWLIPWATLFVPKQLVNDLWRAGGPEPLPSRVTTWWVTWVGCSLLSMFPPVALLLLTKWGLALFLLPYAVLAVLSIRVAVRLTRRLGDVLERASAPA